MDLRSEGENPGADGGAVGKCISGTGEKYREIARAMGVEGVDQMDQATYRKAAVDAVRKLSEDVGIPSKLEALKEEDLPFLAESAHADAYAPGNPKDARVEDLTALFRKLM